MPVTKKMIDKKSDATLQTSIRLNNLTIKNYKSIDILEIEFPKPKTRDDLDALIIGSKNGVGKTSILESCSLLVFYAYYSEFFKKRDNDLIWSMRRYGQTDFFKNLIRSGTENATIIGDFTTLNGSKEEKNANIKLTINQEDCKIDISGEFLSYKTAPKQDTIRDLDNLSDYIRSIVGYNFEIFNINPILYFHSYRKVREGDLELSAVTDGFRKYTGEQRRFENNTANNLFKYYTLLALLSNSKLLVSLDKETGEKMLELLNYLLSKYANACLEETLEPTFNSLKIRIKPKKGDPFPIDGLSSGQKEILQTLFLIWHYSSAYTPLILIDEPELHLNSEWHGSLIKDFKELAPRNQYIIATHSDSVFNSFEPYQRVIIG